MLLLLFDCLTVPILFGIIFFVIICGVKNMSDTKKNLTKKTKIIIAVSVVMVALAAFCIAFLSLTSNNSYHFYNKVVLAIAPDSIEDQGITFYIKENPAYDQNTAPGENMFICYYIDSNGKEVELPGGIYTTEDGTQSIVILGFMEKMAEKLLTIKNVVRIIAVILVIALICILIYLWYRYDKRREEQNKQRRFENKKNKKRK